MVLYQHAFDLNEYHSISSTDEALEVAVAVKEANTAFLCRVSQMLANVTGSCETSDKGQSVPDIWWVQSSSWSLLSTSKKKEAMDDEIRWVKDRKLH